MTSVGAKSGKIRKNPLMRVEHEGSTMRWWRPRAARRATRPGTTTSSRPRVEVQDGPDRREYTVRVVEGPERAAWWERAVAVWPDYATYQTKTDRGIPVFVASPA